MNAKQSKKSRALKRELDKYTKQKAAELNVQKQINIKEIIALYNLNIYALSFHKRAAYCFRVMQCGRSIFNKTTMAYVSTLVLVTAVYVSILFF